MVVKLCEPREKEQSQTYYTQSLERLSHSGNALQHIIISGNEIDDAIDELSNTKKIMGEDTYNSLLNTYKTNIAKQNEAKQELLTRKSNHKQMKMEFKRLKNEHML